jgi:tetratricopeptide (TPR) repeat protein
MTLYRKAFLTSALLGFLVGVGYAQESIESEDGQKAVPAFVAKFGNLPEEDRKNYGEHKLKAEQYFRQKRTFEALDEIHQALAIFDEDPAMWNLLGSCHVEFRSFEKAREAFQRAIALNPGNTGVLFNLAEMDFVTKQWKDCVEKMKKLIVNLEEMSKGEMSEPALQLHHLALFKQMLSLLKLGQEDEARKLAEDNWEDWDDTPFTYYSKAALAYFEENEEEANRWIRSAVRVFGGLEQVANWQDTLIEYGYVRSFYGGDSDTEIEISE